MASKTRQVAIGNKPAAPREAGKRALILTGAARLFGERPFDEVRLEDLARALRIGKGTIYLYFASKEELYAGLLLAGMDDLLARLRAVSAQGHATAWATLSAMVEVMVAWAWTNPHFFKLMPSAEQRGREPVLIEKRRELGKLLEQVIRRGVRLGEFNDPQPNLTAQFIPGCLRAAMRHGSTRIGRAGLTGHILRVVGGGILLPARTTRRGSNGR